jgi:biopolymer transport protein ExbD
LAGSSYPQRIFGINRKLVLTLNSIWEQFQIEFMTIITDGGMLMVPLTILALTIYYTAFKLFYFFSEHKFYKVDRNRLFELVFNKEKAEGELRDVLDYTQADTEITVNQMKGRFAEIISAYLAEVDSKRTYLLILITTAPVDGASRNGHGHADNLQRVGGQYRRKHRRPDRGGDFGSPDYDPDRAHHRHSRLCNGNFNTKTPERNGGLPHHFGGHHRPALRKELHSQPIIVMKRRRVFSTNRGGSEDINISPLIDMVFILLIFFIVTTVFVEETGVEVTKPQAASQIQLEKNSILIAITSNNNVVYGGRDIGVNGVRSVVKRLIQDDPRMPVIIQADENVPTRILVRVIDEAKLAGANSVNISTEET